MAVALPPEVRVKISSEAAGSIAMTQVSQRDLPIRDLVEQALGATGKDVPRIQEILRRGTLVSGESRLRWAGFETSAADLAPVLATFPDPDPARPFDATHCFHVQLVAGSERLDLAKAVGARRRLFRRRSLWDALMQLGRPEYVGYSYKLRCDHYRLHLDIRALASLQSAASLLPYKETSRRIALTGFDAVELFARRRG